MRHTAERRLLDMWRLVRAAARDNKRLSTGDIAVLMALCDRYGSKFNPDLPPIAGQALLGSMAHLSKRAAFASTHRLIEAGYIEVIEPGSGTRGTKYQINFASGEADFIAKDDRACDEAQFTDAVRHASSLEDPSDEAEFIQYLPTRPGLQAGGLEGGEPVLDAPLVAAAIAALPRAGRDDFEDFWDTYPRKFKRAAAKASWEKLGLDDQSAAIAGAGAYSAHCQEAGREARFIKQAANWLAEECWLEDPTAGFTTRVTKPERVAQARKAKTANDNRPANIRGGVTNMSAGDRLVEIVGCIEPDWYTRPAQLKLTLRDGDGEEFRHVINVCAVDEDEERAGRDCYKSICAAAGGEAPQVGQFVWAAVGKTITYRAALAPRSAQGATP